MASVFHHSPSAIATSLGPPRRNRRLLSSSFQLRASSSSQPSPSLDPLEPKVVVTREQGKNAKLIGALAKHSIPCVEFPLIKHTEGPDTASLPALLCDREFEWIVITSPEAASVFLEAWKIAGTPKVRIAVVGAGTATVFKEKIRSSEQNLEVAFTPSTAMGKVLASELPNYGHENCKVLYPASVKAGNEIEEGLSKRGFEVTRMNTYNTVPIQDIDQTILEQALSAPVVAVASPSAIRVWVNLISKSENWNNSVACIGETTAVAAKKLGLKNVYYPEKPGFEGWISSILEALRIQEQHQKFVDKEVHGAFLHSILLNYSSSMEMGTCSVLPTKIYIGRYLYFYSHAGIDSYKITSKRLDKPIKLQRSIL